ncbi:MAG: ImmA/IrrE family metallo-endopeptidase [Thermodesulfobacteriota bacterium]
MVKRKAVENTQVKDDEVERLIKKSIREMRRETDIKDKGRLRKEEMKIRSRIEYENSFAGIFNNLKFFGDTAEDEKRKRIVAQTLLKLPYKVRKKTIDEVLFISMSTTGVTFNFEGSVKLSKKDFKQNGNIYQGRIQLHFIILNFRKCRKDRKMDVTAHEIAHFILGHHLKKNTNRGIIEREAEELAEKWGFRRGYKDYNF